ncbi:MAG: LysR family transcriptional regulator [Myxococcota bacterium]
MDELLAMETFVRVAEAGSFTRAARQLGASQGTISRRINELEATLGVTLLQRTTRSVSLTDAGAAYHDACIEALAAVARAREALLPEQRIEGTLRIAAPLTYTTAWLAPRLRGFLEQYPELSVELMASNERGDVVAEGVAEGVDMALRIGAPHLQHATARTLGETRQLAVASPAYLERRGTPTLDNLDDHEVMSHALNDGGASWTVEQSGRERRIKPTYTVRADSGDVLKKIVISGYGLAVLPDWLVEDELRDGVLVTVLGDVRFSTSAIRALWLGRARPPARVRAFIDWLVEAHQKRRAEKR